MVKNRMYVEHGRAQAAAPGDRKHHFLYQVHIHLYTTTQRAKTYQDSVEEPPPCPNDVRLLLFV